MCSATLTHESSMPHVNPQASKSTNPLITACRDTTQKRGRFSWPSRGALVGAALKVSILALMIICEDVTKGCVNKGGWVN